MEKWFEKQSRLVQILLLLIPGVNWVVEVLVRWSHALRKGSLVKYLIAIFVTVFGIVVGWVDVIWCLLFKHLIFCD
ncbi:MAG: hypothetical protein SOW55_03760 [Bacilli bacterium]|nr:hypothetical protein [Bacillales bacterium]MDY2575071.1 hypothetical protein [Bacilli bacterium]